MTKILYAHDHQYFEIDGSIYTESQFEANYWQRYLDCFSALVVVAREGTNRDRLAPSNLGVSARPEIKFLLQPNLSSVYGQTFPKYEVRKKIESCLRSVDGVIARLPSEIGLLAAAAAHRANKPWAIELAGCPFDGLWNYGRIAAKTYAPIMAARTRRMVAQAPFILYVTADFLQSRYPNHRGKSVVCSNVDIPVPDKKVLDSRLSSIGKNLPLRLGIIATLQTRYKGLETIFQSLKNLIGTIAPFELRILGNGDPSHWRMQAARHGLSEVVFFDGTLPPGKPVYEWLDNVDIYLQPSLKEGLPRALIEAMSRGCPSLGSRCGGIPELLDNSCLINPKDSSHLSELILRMIQSRPWQIDQAKINWKKAGCYSSARLHGVRREFWEDFRSYIHQERS